MKKLIISLCSLLLLTSCSMPKSTPVQGRLVGCEEVKTVTADDEALECLAGGEPISVDSIRGPAIINIWGTWCAPCREELPHLAQFFSDYGDRVDVIGIAVEEKNQATVRKFVKSNGITWPILYDATGVTQEKFGPGVPVTWFIGKSGKVTYKKYGPFRSTEELELAAAKYLGVK